MDIYTISILCAFGALSRMSHLLSIETLSDIGLMIESRSTITVEEAKRNYLGFQIGNLLLISSFVYGFIFYRNWSSLIYLLSAGIISIILLKIFEAILGGTLSRLLFIWILPIIGSIYFAIKVI